MPQESNFKVIDQRDRKILYLCKKCMRIVTIELNGTGLVHIECPSCERKEDIEITNK